MRRLLAFLLLLEASLTAVDTASLVARLGGYDAAAVTIIVARTLVGALQLASGVFLNWRRPSAVALARTAFVASAIVTTFAVGLQLAPTNVYPWLRWHFVAGYWLYALVALVILRRRDL